MCGIVGYVGFRQASDILLEGLRRLEYRGYDSAGIAVSEAGEIAIRKKAGRVQELGKLVPETRFTGRSVSDTHAGRPTGCPAI